MPHNVCVTSCPGNLKKHGKQSPVIPRRQLDFDRMAGLGLAALCWQTESSEKEMKFSNSCCGSEILNTVVSFLSWNKPGYFDRFVLCSVYTPFTVPQILSKMQRLTPTHSLPSRASFMIHFCISVSLILSSTPSPLTHVTDALYLTVHREPVHIHFP